MVSEGQVYRTRVKPEVVVYLDTRYPGFFERLLRLADSLVVFYGKTTADGAVDGSDLICADLTEKPDFSGHIVVILSGDYTGQARGISGTTLGGTVTVAIPFGGRILAGTEFAILAIRTTELGDIEVKLDAIKLQTDKLAGLAPVTGLTTDNWQVGEANVVSIGANDVSYKLHSLVLSILNLIGTIITIRMYMKVNGVDRRVYDQTFDATTDPPGLWIVNGTVAIHEVLRVTLQSNNAADNGKAVDYDYLLEAM
jgi:hypothetical protein